VIRRKTTGGYHAMDMGMMLEPLIPGVQDAEESYFGTKMLRVAGDLAERFGTGPEQKA